ncbi:MAG: methyl-accepting chemotaxis protein, partial [Thermodesulfovibrionia bacterium]|nr:methyl-accepting chemotaxis protein [Thermodesulfovibrionia bacterium]
MKWNLEHKVVGLVIASLILYVLFIGLISIAFIRTDIRYIVDTYSGSTIDFIKYSIEESLVTGNADVTIDLISKKRSSQNLEKIMVYNADGQEVFSKYKRKIQPESVLILDTIRKTNSAFSRETENSIDYYMPLINSSRCIGCHDKQISVLGFVKVSMFIKDAKERILYRTKIIIMSLIFSTIFFGVGLWIIFKRTVISPVKGLERATKSLSSGNLSFHTDIHSKDEIGLLNKYLKSSVRDVSAIIKKAFTVSEKVGKITQEVGTESKKFANRTQLEAKASDSIYASVEGLEKSIGGITENIDALSLSSEEVTVAVDEMVANNEQITQNTVELFGSVDLSSCSVEEISSSIQGIVGRAKGLTIASEETLRAIEKINSALKEIELSTKEAVRVSKKVTSDATTFGMDAVQRTREGMEG